MDARKENPHKIYVKVRCDCDVDGQIKPLMFRAEEGRTLRIDQITEVRRAASTRAGGCGVRYTCRIGEAEIYLFHDRDWWFVEREQLYGED